MKARAMLVAVALAIAAITAMPAFAAERRASLPDIEDEVMCLTCGTSLSIANGPAADDQRALINRLIAEGKTKDEILDVMVEEYGPEILAKPEASGVDLAVYAIPSLLFVVLGGGVVVAARRWRRRAIAADGKAGSAASLNGAGPELSQADRDRLDRELAGID